MSLGWNCPGAEVLKTRYSERQILSGFSLFFIAYRVLFVTVSSLLRTDLPIAIAIFLSIWT
ncbi:MAG: hypothetical protein SAJ12_04680 [Jaaginema sp. PMC 1079.18]|nr:hypothetical protein [Jaaginema sp. PMC 1080.18]MEC4850287.1 hypothetical protein [Jaaginema sp. PMC 1079.18]MEC4867390.1 hypothetical protein [Jaaginema sp. PMC 1078.18]